MKRISSLYLFFGAEIVIAASMGINESIFNNFLSDTFELTAEARGALEFPRELPGFLVVLFAGILGALSLPRMGALAALVFAAGTAGLGLAGNSYGLVVASMLVSSVGMHLNQPISHSLTIAMSEDDRRGFRLGQLGGLRTFGTVLGTGLVWMTFRRDVPPYLSGFLYAAAGGVAAAILYAQLKVPGVHYRRSFFVIRRKFRLYYVLEFLFGARKQIFITFGPWVLIHVYGLSPGNIAFLLMLASIIGLVFKPLAGWVMDAWGERLVMVGDGLVLTLVCLGYGFAGSFPGGPKVALCIAGSCFILDNLLFALSTGRTVYVSRLSSSPDELTGTLSLGVTMNHVASMVIPFWAGLMWKELGFQVVFASAGVLALLLACFSWFVPGKRARAPIMGGDLYTTEGQAP
ncbi:MAG TPA: MFS transporter [Candidatus Hydrogenedentes bacterium]|nr:MFS transporter [Candidatus Hydrogenedentota bacterium]